ncbi:DUF3102 domain-containing protein [Hyphomicrobium sp. 2TAF46]|uniref:DUF3102 domain-containing protein n=1 Tax=Hyphomicrobium sp. 2TAF46 TaxID=3233019 RepID=UPI003F92472C
MNELKLKKLADSIRNNLVRVGEEERRLRLFRLQVGRDLIEARKALPHGKFLPWVKAEFSMSQRSAYNYMELAESIDKIQAQPPLKVATLANLPDKTVLALAKAPEKVRKRLAAKVADGEKITAPVVLKLLKPKKDPLHDLRTSACECVEFLFNALGDKKYTFFESYDETLPMLFHAVLMDARRQLQEFEEAA